MSAPVAPSASNDRIANDRVSNDHASNDHASNDHASNDRASNERPVGDHTEPTVTSTSDNHSANISKQDPHSVAHETVPPESRPVGQDEHGTTGPDDAPPGAPEGENYPPQKHAGQVGFGPHYADVHGKEAVCRLGSLKVELKTD